MRSDPCIVWNYLRQYVAKLKGTISGYIRLEALTSCGRSGKCWPEVAAVQTECIEIHSKTTKGQYFPVRRQQARLESSLLSWHAKQKQKYTAYDHFDACTTQFWLCEKEPNRTLGFTTTLPCQTILFLNFCRIFPLEVERKFKSWFLNLYDELVVTNWLNAHDELVVARFGNKNSVFNSLYFYCIYIALFTETCIFGIV